MGDRCGKVGRRLDAALTGVESRVAAKAAKNAQDEQEKAGLARRAEVLRRQAAVLRKK